MISPAATEGRKDYELENDDHWALRRPGKENPGPSWCDHVNYALRSLGPELDQLLYAFLPLAHSLRAHADDLTAARATACRLGAAGTGGDASGSATRSLVPQGSARTAGAARYRPVGGVDPGSGASYGSQMTIRHFACHAIMKEISALDLGSCARVFRGTSRGPFLVLCAKPCNRVTAHRQSRTPRESLMDVITSIIPRARAGLIAAVPIPGPRSQGNIHPTARP